MGKARFIEDFKRDAVHQIVERGYPVAEVSQRLGVSTHSLYGWMKCFSNPDQSGSSDDQAAEIRRLKSEWMRVTEERDILKKGHRVLRARCKVEYAFVSQHRPMFSVRAMCRCLRIHPRLVIKPTLAPVVANHPL
jgi:putative transposase